MQVVQLKTNAFLISFVNNLNACSLLYISLHLIVIFSGLYVQSQAWLANYILMRFLFYRAISCALIHQSRPFIHDNVSGILASALTSGAYTGNAVYLELSFRPRWIP